MEEQRQKQILQALREITLEVSAQSSLDKAISTLVSRIREDTGADCCSLYLCDSQRRYLKLVATDGLSQSAVGKASLLLGEGLVGLVGKTQELLNLSDAPAHPNFKYMPEVGEDEFRSFLGVPVLNQGDLVGVLVIQTIHKRLFGDEEESFLVTLSAQVASVLAAQSQQALQAGPEGKRYHGISGTGGIAIARAFVWQRAVSFEDVQLLYSDDTEVQLELYHQVLFQLQIEMDRAALKMREESREQAVSGYLSGYGRILDDYELREEVEQEISVNHLIASSAIKSVTSRRIENAQKLEEFERVKNLRDFAEVMIERLVHTSIAANSNITEDEQIILVVDSLPTAWVAELPPNKVVGFVCIDKATSAHTSILARGLGIPSVIGVDIDTNAIDGKLMIIDGAHFDVLVEPAESVEGEYRQLMIQSNEQRHVFAAEQYEKGVTLDSRHITIGLNAGLNSASVEDLPRKTDGIGLYRTEIAFMLSQTFPSEQTQTEWYRKLLAQFAKDSLPVCMRTLDVGGDKSLEYLPIEETNPALGWRGVRVTVDQPQILRTQLRAMLQAQAEFGNLEIMVPMVMRMEEVLTVKRILLECKEHVEKALGREIKMPRFGVMIEVPATVFLLEDLAKEVDFFSIGSNDLISYLLAVDRSNPKVSGYFDAFHPAVVRCLAKLHDESERLGRDIAVCGEIAGSPLGALLLLSLGYDKLSMNYSELSRVKYVVRRVSYKDLRAIGEQALKLNSTADIRKLYQNYAKEQGLERIAEYLQHSSKDE